MDLVATQGALNWVKISTMLESRTPKQCRERYHQNLKPSLNHEPITAEEGAVIERLVGELGKRWAEIARRLHNRSDNAVKNWWNGSMNRRRRMIRRKAPAYEDPVDHHSYPRVPAPLRLPPVAPYSQYPQYSSASPTTSRFQHGGWSPQSGLPSPSTASPGTSPLQAAPSLVSDNGSIYSTSPRTGSLPESNLDLPPLRIGDTWSPQSQEADSPKLPSMFSRQDQVRLPPIRDAVDGKTQLPTAPNSPVALPSPGMRSPTLMVAEEAKDSRMKLNNLLS